MNSTIFFLFGKPIFRKIVFKKHLLASKPSCDFNFTKKFSVLIFHFTDAHFFCKKKKSWKQHFHCMHAEVTGYLISRNFCVGERAFYWKCWFHGNFLFQFFHTRKCLPLFSWNRFLFYGITNFFANVKSNTKVKDSNPLYAVLIFENHADYWLI